MPSSFDLKDDSSDALANLLTQARFNRKTQEREIEAKRTAAAQEQADKLAMLLQQDKMARQARKDFGSDVPVNIEGVSIGARDPFQQVTGALKMRELSQPSLTPAQEAAERAAGKQITEYTVMGGKPVIDKDLAQIEAVQQELASGDRDAYDRTVGGFLSTSPTLMGLFAPKEKGRRDRARNAAINIAKATDPNPTEKQIEAIYGQVYDPSAPNPQNEMRLRNFHSAQKGKAAQLESATQKYKQTGYATVGGAPIQQPAAGGLSAEEAAELAQLRKELGQ